MSLLLAASVVGDSIGAQAPPNTPVSNLDIHSVGIGGNLVNITKNPAVDTSPAISPDGSRIAFVSTRDGQPDVYVMDTDGSNVRRVTTSPLNPTGRPKDDSYVVADRPTRISWAPDSGTFAFDALDPTPADACLKCGGQWNVFVVDASGSGLRRLAEYAASPSWSPAGTRIAYAYGIGPSGEAAGIRVTRIDGSSFFDVNAVNHVAAHSPVWSPRRGKLAFSARRRPTGSKYDIQVIGADGSARRRLTTGRAPAWAPDGRTLSFLRNGRLHTIGTDGRGGLRQLPPNHIVKRPAWSPTGRWIAFIRNPPAGPPSLQIVRPDGSRGRVLASFLEGTRLEAGVWTRDGSRLYFAGTPASP